MFNELQIKEIVDQKVELFKKSETDKKTPEYTEVYKESVDIFERVSIHSESGKFPEKLFINRAPNQTKEEFDYMKSTFKKPTTFPIWTRFKSTINRIWNDQNWSIKWSSEVSLDATTETPQDYIEKEYPNFRSLEEYYKSIVTSRKEEDSNAVICHKPFYVPVKVNENNEVILDDTQRVKPVACIYEASQLVGYTEGLYALILLKERSMVSYGNTMQKVGLVFEFYDDQNIYKIIQVGKKVDYKFEIYVYWNHKLGYLPVDKLKGIPLQRESEILYQPHFYGAVDAMDEILLDESYLRAIKAGQAFPHKWEYVDECDYTNDSGACINGRIMVDRGDGPVDSDCPKCHGTGKSKSSSPLGVYQVTIPNQRGTGGSENMKIPPFGWESPDPGTMEFLRKEIDVNEQKALNILNLNASNSDVKGSDTALGKQIDREELFSLIQSISNQTFELFEFSIKCILQMRYGLGVELPVINYPKNFSIRNEADLTNEIAAAKAAGLPDIAIRKILLEYLNTRFSGQEEATKAINLAFYSDRLVSLSTLDIAQKKLSGGVANWEDILHTSIYTFIEDLINTEPGFLGKDIELQKNALVEKAKAIDLEIGPKKLNPDAIIANVNG